MEALQQISLFSSLFYVALGVAGIGLLLTVFLYFYFDIPTVYALLSGKAKKKSIERMMAVSEKGESIRAKSSTSRKLKEEAAKLVVTTPSEQLARQNNTGETKTEANTTVISEPLPKNADAPQSEPVLPQAQETTVLTEEQTVDDMFDPGGKTMLLTDRRDTSNTGLNFELIEQIILIHTEEII